MIFESPFDSIPTRRCFLFAQIPSGAQAAQPNQLSCPLSFFLSLSLSLSRSLSLFFISALSFALSSSLTLPLFSFCVSLCLFLFFQSKLHWQTISRCYQLESLLHVQTICVQTQVPAWSIAPALICAGSSQLHVPWHFTTSLPYHFITKETGMLSCHNCFGKMYSRQFHVFYFLKSVCNERCYQTFLKTLINILIIWLA